MGRAGKQQKEGKECWVNEQAASNWSSIFTHKLYCNLPEDRPNLPLTRAFPD